MEIEPINAENLAAQRRKWSRQIQQCLQGQPLQPEGQEEKGLLAYARKYLHPQATWLDCQRILAHQLLEKPLSPHPFPWEYLPPHSNSGLVMAEEPPSPKALFRFHKLPYRGFWALPENWAAVLLEGLQKLSEKGAPQQGLSLKALFASGYDLPFLRQCQEAHLSGHLLSPHLPDALALAEQLEAGHFSVFWINPWLAPQHPCPSPALFSPDAPWKEAVRALPERKPDWIYLNALHAPMHRFERGNQKFHEGIDHNFTRQIFGEDFLGENKGRLSLAARQLGLALQSCQQGRKSLIALLPDECCWSPEWRDWRVWVQEHFAQQFLIREPQGAWTACILCAQAHPGYAERQWATLPASLSDSPIGSWEEMEDALEQEADIPLSWKALEWEELGFEQGSWVPRSERPFFLGLPLFPRLAHSPDSPLISSKKTNGKSPQAPEESPAIFAKAQPLAPSPFPQVNGLTEEEAAEKWEATKQNLDEPVPEGDIVLRYLCPGVLRYVWEEKREGAEETAGWYISRFPHGALAVGHSVQLPFFGKEEEGYFLSEPEPSAKAVKAFQAHYRPKVPVPTGLPVEHAQGWVGQLRRSGRQLPVLQKFINRLEGFAEDAKGGEIPVEAFSRNKELIEQFKQKIQLLYRGANERKKMFQQLLQVLGLWERSLNDITKAREQALAKQEAVNAENVLAYVYAVLREEGYAECYCLGLCYQPPRIPFYEDFWAWAAQGKGLLERHLSPTPEQSPFLEEWNEDAPQSLPVFRVDGDKREIQVDSQLRLSELPEELFTPTGKAKDSLKHLFSAFRKKRLHPWNEETWVRYREQFLRVVSGEL